MKANSFFGTGAMFVVILGLHSSASGEDIHPGKAIEYRPMYPEKWKAKKQSTQMIPWEGKHVVLLTTTADLDREVMTLFLDRLDRAWQLYADYTGLSPQPHMLHNNKVTIAAVPDSSFTCGAGCGFIGFTGIEVGVFYSWDYPNTSKNRKQFSDYYFYEMARNYFRFGNRHSTFTTGFSVFMRYVCMDALDCENRHAEIHKKLAAAEAEFAKSKLTFLQGFTTVTTGGRDEYVDLIPGYPSNAASLYASAMLKLRGDHGGDEWVKAFFKYLRKCPAIPWVADLNDSGTAQGLNWLVAASCAARQDLSPVFVERWKLPLGKKSREALKGVDWKQKDLSPSAILASLPADELPASLKSVLSALLPPEVIAANRKAAEKVIDLGGSVNLVVDGDESSARSLAELPAGAFEVRRISFEYGNRKVTDASLEVLKGLSGLRELGLGGVEGVSNAGVAHVKDLKGLVALGLDGTKVTDDVCNTLTQLPSLETLTLNGTRVTDKGVAKLASIKTLKTLWLSGTAVTDAGVKELSGLPRLEILQIANTKVTDQGVAALKVALPKLRVDR
jgi:hypothetical protein